MYGDGLLKVMFVGGGNERKDYHIEEGEVAPYKLLECFILTIAGNILHA